MELQPDGTYIAVCPDGHWWLAPACRDNAAEPWLECLQWPLGNPSASFGFPFETKSERAFFLMASEERRDSALDLGNLEGLNSYTQASSLREAVAKKLRQGESYRASSRASMASII